MSPLQKSLHENVARYGHLEQLFDEYDCDDFDPYRFIASLPVLTPLARPSCLPKKSPHMPPVTLVLDLDETLVHCSTDASEIRNPDFIFHVEFQGVVYTVNCRKRPGVDEFLEYVRGRFEVVVFTASQKVYADKLLDILDASHEVIHHRVFRDDCTNVEGNYLKDLSVLGRDLRSVLIVDNSPQAFAFQLDNGVPILSWFDSRSDRELYKIIPLLDSLLDVDDVRPTLRERFRLHSKVEAYTEPPFSARLGTFEQCLADSLESVA
jgi:CTD small phosphatase-like protein 2